MYSQRKIVLMLAALLALAAIVAGCGGGDSSSSSSAGSTGDSTSGAEAESSSGDESGSDSESDAEDESGSDDSGGAAPTKAAFIKEADKICGDQDAVMVEEITDYAKENDIPIEEEEPSEEQQIEIFHAVVLPNIHKQAEEIAALTPPEGEEEKVEELTDTLSSEVEEAEDEEGTPDESSLEGATELAHEFGLKTCGN